MKNGSVQVDKESSDLTKIGSFLFGEATSSGSRYRLIYAHA